MVFALLWIGCGPALATPTTRPTTRASGLVVHLNYGDGTDIWGDLGSQRTFFSTRKDGKLVEARMMDHRDQKIWGFYAGFKEGWQQKEKLGVFPKSALEFVLLPNERAWYVIRGTRTDEQPDVLEGRAVIRVDLSADGPAGTKGLIKRVWADAKTREPIRVERHRADGKVETSAVEISQSGPVDLTDLDVGYEVKFRDDDASSAEARAIVEASKKAVTAFPNRLRLVRWRAAGDGQAFVGITYRDGQKIRSESYGPARKLKKGFTLKTAAEALAWAEKDAKCNSVTLIDPQFRCELDGKAEDAKKVTWSPSVDEGTDSWMRVYLELWQQVQNIGPTVVVKDAKDVPEGCVLLRQDRGSDVREFVVDPARGYVCRLFTLVPAGGVGCSQRITKMDLKQMANGSWYAARMAYDVLEVQVEVSEAGDELKEKMDFGKIVEGVKARGGEIKFGGV
jgi:hypothetical protein